MIFSLPKVDSAGIRAVHTSPANRLGEYFYDNETNSLYVYLRAFEAIQQGQAVGDSQGVYLSAGLEAAAAGSRRLTFGSTVNLETSLEHVPQRPRYAEYAIVQAFSTSTTAATSDQYGTVYSYDAQSCEVEWWTSDDLSLQHALAADHDIYFDMPWLVGTATGGQILGFAQTAVAEGRYFWALVEGVGLGRRGGTAIGGLAAQVDASGLLVSAVASDTDDVVADILTGGGPTLTGANRQLLPILARATSRIGIPPFSGGRSTQAYQHPSTTT